MTLYTNRYRLLSRQDATAQEEATTPATTQDLSYQELRGVGREITFYENQIRIANNTAAKLSEQIRKRESKGMDASAQRARLESVQSQINEYRNTLGDMQTQYGAAYEPARKAAPKKYISGQGKTVYTFTFDESQQERPTNFGTPLKGRTYISSNKDFLKEKQRLLEAQYYANTGQANYNDMTRGATDYQYITSTTEAPTSDKLPNSGIMRELAKKGVFGTTGFTGDYSVEPLQRDTLANRPQYSSLYGYSTRAGAVELFPNERYDARPNIRPLEKPLTPAQEYQRKGFLYDEMRRAATNPRDEARYTLLGGLYSYRALTVGTLESMRNKKKEFFTGAAFGGAFELGGGAIKRAGSKIKFIGEKAASRGVTVLGVGLGALYVGSKTKEFASFGSTPKISTSPRLYSSESVFLTSKRTYDYTSDFTAGAAAETLGVFTGAKATGALLPSKPFGVAKPKTIEWASSAKGIETTRGSATSPMMIEKPTTTFYSRSEFEGLRGLKGESVRTVTRISKRGGLVQQQFSKDFISVIRQSPNSKTSTMTVYRGGKIKRYYLGDTKAEFSGIETAPYYSEFKRAEKSFEDGTALKQIGRRTSLYGESVKVGRDKYLISTAEQRGTVIAVSRSAPSVFYRDISQVEKIGLSPKRRGTVKTKLGDYEFPVTKVSKQDSPGFVGAFSSGTKRYVFENEVIQPKAPIVGLRRGAGKSVFYHEQGHGFTLRKGILNKEARFFSKQNIGRNTFYKEGRALQESGLIEKRDFFSSYSPQERPGEVFAELYKAKSLSPAKFKRTAPKINALLERADKDYRFSFYTKNQQVRTVGAPKRELYGVTDTVLRTAPEARAQKDNLLVSRLSIVDAPLPREQNVAYPVKTLTLEKGRVNTRIVYRIITTGRIELLNIGRAPTVLDQRAKERVNKRVERQSPRRTEQLTRLTESPRQGLIQQQTTVTRSISRLDTRTLPRTSVTFPKEALTKTRSTTIVAPITRSRASARVSPIMRNASASITRSTPRVASIPKSSLLSENRLSQTSISAAKLRTSQITQTLVRTPRFDVPFSPTTPRTPPIITPPSTGGLLGRSSGGAGSRSRSLFKQSKGYTPSLFAIGLGIKGKRPGKQALRSGISIRPIEG